MFLFLKKSRFEKRPILLPQSNASLRRLAFATHIENLLHSRSTKRRSLRDLRGHQVGPRHARGQQRLLQKSVAKFGRVRPRLSTLDAQSTRLHSGAPQTTQLSARIRDARDTRALAAQRLARALLHRPQQSQF